MNYTSFGNLPHIEALYKVIKAAKDSIDVSTSQIEELKLEQLKLEQLKLEEEESKFKYDDPMKWEKVWYLISSGGVVHSEVGAGSCVDAVVLMGNFYKTRHQAYVALEVKIAQAKIVKRITELNEGWVPDWEDRDQSKFSVIYNTIRGLTLSNHYSNKNKSNNLYLKSPDLAKTLISELPDELELVLTQ